MAEQARKAEANAFAEYTDKFLTPQVNEEEKRAEDIAKLYVEFSTNDKGEELANIQTSQAF